MRQPRDGDPEPRRIPPTVLVRNLQDRGPSRGYERVEVGIPSGTRRLRRNGRGEVVRPSGRALPFGEEAEDLEGVLEIFGTLNARPGLLSHPEDRGGIEGPQIPFRLRIQPAA